MSLHLGETTWPEHWSDGPRPLLIVPIGACEQHGPHLPLDTDTRIAVALAEGLAEKYEPGTVMVTPPISISASGEHRRFPGTLSIGTEVLEHLLVEVGRSADWSSGVVFVNGHGGNRMPVEKAVRTLQREHRRVMSWWPRVEGGDAHAGHTETSIMLALAPHLVRLSKATKGNTQPLSEIIDALRTEGVHAVSESGVLGDPKGASATAGRAILTRLSIDLVAAVDDWWE